MRLTATPEMRARFPRVSAWRRGKRVRPWRDVFDAWQSADMQAAIVSVKLLTPVVNVAPDALALDGILCWAALTQHEAPSAWGDAEQIVIPTPLKCAWISAEGFPLWLATPLLPATEAARSAEYWHKRTPSHVSDFADKSSINTTAGRWKEYRSPLATLSTDRLHGLCIGDIDEIKRLLSIVTHIGKKPSAGYGRVQDWTVTPSEYSADEILARRNTPIDYLAGKEISGVVKPFAPWTPPYWDRPRWRACVGPSFDAAG